MAKLIQLVWSLTQVLLTIIYFWNIEIKSFELTPEDKFIIVGSDGIFEFMQNEEIAQIVWPFYVKHAPEAAGNALVRAAAQRWKENDTVIDDITCIIIFLEIDWYIA